VIAQCSDGEQAYSLVSGLNPDIAILEHGLGKLYVLEAVRKLRAAGSQTRILILSARQDRKLALDSLRSGANGYLLKSSLVRDLKEALEQSVQGAVWMAPQVAAADGPGSDPLNALSRREHQVFNLLIEGLRAKEIAARLEVSSKSVDTYRANLMRKLEIHDVAGLVKFAISRKLT
jgi:DNA-binding NarL/FixJ family response regulator